MVADCIWLLRTGKRGEDRNAGHKDSRAQDVLLAHFGRPYTTFVIVVTRSPPCVPNELGGGGIRSGTAVHSELAAEDRVPLANTVVRSVLPTPMLFCPTTVPSFRTATATKLAWALLRRMPRTVCRTGVKPRKIPPPRLTRIATARAPVRYPGGGRLGGGPALKQQLGIGATERSVASPSGSRSSDSSGSN